jgi:hypothetical protein
VSTWRVGCLRVRWGLVAPPGAMSQSSGPYGLAPAVTPGPPPSPSGVLALYDLCGCQGLSVAPGKFLAASMSKRLPCVPRVSPQAPGPHLLKCLPLINSSGLTGNRCWSFPQKSLLVFPPEIVVGLSPGNCC